LKIRFIPLMFVFLALILSGANAAKDVSAASAKEIMPISEIKPGMKGYGLSVFKGTDVERFDVEILGVMHNAFAEMDLILARLSSPYLKSGVIAGMSGSPVFIDGRMIGAVSYGWSFSMEPIAGITPIEKMLEVYEMTNDKEHPDEIPPIGDFPQKGESKSSDDNLRLLPVKSQSIKIQTGSVPGLKDINNQIPESITMEPLNTPLVISGCSPSALNRLNHHLRDTNFIAVMGGGAPAGGAPIKDAPVENGSPLALSFMSGSMNMAAIGTVTYRKGDKLVAFGHPFVEFGNADVPMGSGSIFTIVSGYARSFKMGAMVKEVGCIRQDRTPGIGGIFGMNAPSFDIDVNLKMAHSTKKFHYKAWENRLISPMILDMALYSSIMDNDKQVGASTAKIHYVINLADGSKIERWDFVSTDMFLAYDISMPAVLDLRTLLNNQFKKVDVTRIQFDAEISDQFRVVQIESARLNKDVYKPGEKVQAKVFFSTYRQPHFSRTVEIELPENIRDGTYNLEIVDSRGRTRLEIARSPGIGNVFTFEGLIKILNIGFPQNNLYALLTEREMGLKLMEAEMPGMPQNILAITQSAAVANQATPINFSFIREKKLETEFQINGRAALRVKVDHLGRR